MTTPPPAHRWKPLAADLACCEICRCERFTTSGGRYYTPAPAHVGAKASRDQPPCQPPQKAPPAACTDGLHGARCRLIRTLLDRLAAGEGLAAVERDYGLCAGTLSPITAIRARARRAQGVRLARRPRGS